LGRPIFPIDADFSTYALGTLNGQNSWDLIGLTNTTNPIQVVQASVSAGGPIPQSIRITGVASSAASYIDIPSNLRFDPTTVTESTTFYYVLDNFRIREAMNSSSSQGQGVFAITTNLQGVSPQAARLYVRRFGGITSNTTTFDLGIVTSGTVLPTYGTTALTVGISYKIVVAYTANPGSANDVVRVYVNPIGTDVTTWSHETAQISTADPTASFKSFQIVPGYISNNTKLDMNVGRILAGLSNVLDVTPIAGETCSNNVAKVVMYGTAPFEQRTLSPIEYAPYGKETYQYGDEVVRFDGSAWIYSNATYGELVRVYSYVDWPWLVPWTTPYSAARICP
jgi:hypothetical protein